MTSTDRHRLVTLLGLAVAIASARAGAAAPADPSAPPGTGTAVAGASARHDLEASWGAKISMSRATGVASSVRFPRGAGLVAPGVRSAEGGAAEFFRRFGAAFGVSDATRELSLAGSQDDQIGMRHLSYTQLYRGVEVFGGQLRVHIDAQGRVQAVNGVFVPGIDLDTNPRLDSSAAAAAAIAEVTARPPVDESTGQPIDVPPASLAAASSKLYVYREGLTQGLPGPVRLVYQVEVADGAAVREFVFVDAQSGKIVNRYSGIHGALSRRVSETTLANVVWDEGNGNPDPIPAGWAGGTAAQVGAWNNEIDGAKDIYNLLANLTAGTYLSYDGASAVMRTVHDDATINCPNAHWTGVFTGYCAGVTSDDIVAHEWGHAYTEYTHNLVYQWQPGALNEAYSDIWGETVDLLNGRGTDAPGPTRSDGDCSDHGPQRVELTVNAPPAIAGSYRVGTASFGPAITTAGVTGDLVLANDGVAATSVTDACEPLVNGAAVSGKIALVDRGTCSFVVKVKNAQNAGAIAVVVANNVPGAPGNMLGADPTITIPSVMVSQATGSSLKTELGNGVVNVTLATLASEDSYRWLMGEDSPGFGGAIRDMWSPSCASDPAKVLDADYFCATDDSGGVHTNSGVPNHGYALLVDGGTFNGQTVAAIGLTKAAHIYWRAQSVYQTRTSGFPEHADALEQSCEDLVGVALEGLSTTAPIGTSAPITAADCDAVRAMALAVELDADPAPQCGFLPLLAPNPPALCANAAPNVATTIFLADFEGGLGGFTRSNQGVYAGWPSLDWVQATVLPGGRSGAAAFGTAPDDGECDQGAGDISGVMLLETPDIVIPAANTSAPRLAFDHYVATEQGFDGGNLKISINGGPFTLIPAAAFTFNAYPRTLVVAGNTSPLAGQAAFTGTDGGSAGGSWGQSQVDLGAVGVVPGDTIRLRYDMGLDGCGGVDGWYVDDVRIYGCEPVPPCGNGAIDAGEACDDGGTSDGDGCSSTCTLEAGYTCTGQPSVCAPTCGDGTIIAPETCDDGNTADGDCCSSTCRLQSCTVTAAKDAFLRRRPKNTNEGANRVLSVRNRHNRTVVAFDLTGKNLAAVTSASLVLKVQRNLRGWGAGGKDVEVHALLQDFAEGNGQILRSTSRTRGTGAGVTNECAADLEIANVATDCATPWGGGDFTPAATDTVLHTNATAGPVAFDVTSDVRAGLGRWMVKRADESGPGGVYYYSREGAALAADPSLAPQLELHY